METISAHWSEIALGLITFLGTVTAVTSSEKDDKIVDVLRRILNAVVLGRNTKNRKLQK